VKRARPQKGLWARIITTDKTGFPPPIHLPISQKGASETDRFLTPLEIRLSPLEAARSGTPFLTPFLEPGLHRCLFPILLTAEDWLLDLQPKPNTKCLENALRTLGSNAVIFVLLIS